MLRHRGNASHPVYWPAFADILTVVIVMLICILAVNQNERARPVPTTAPAPPIRTENAGPVKEAPAATVVEFENKILADRNKCLIAQLRSLLRAGAVESGPAIRVCGFSKNDGGSCRRSLDEIVTNLAGHSLRELEAQTGVNVQSVFLQARTGFNSSSAPFAKALLTESHETLRSRVEQSWSSRLAGDHYEEQGVPERGTELTLVLATRLPAQEMKDINDLWKKEKWNELENERELAGHCRVH
jgi:hypothetical protein